MMENAPLVAPLLIWLATGRSEAQGRGRGGKRAIEDEPWQQREGRKCTSRKARDAREQRRKVLGSKTAFGSAIYEWL